MVNKYYSVTNFTATDELEDYPFKTDNDAWAIISIGNDALILKKIESMIKSFNKITGNKKTGNNASLSYLPRVSGIFSR